MSRLCPAHDELGRPPTQVFSVATRVPAEQRLFESLKLASLRQLNGHPECVKNASELLMQFLLSDFRVTRLIARKIKALPKSKAIDTLAFLKKTASFYELDLLLEDQRSFFSHLNVWKKTLRESKKKSPVDITKVEGWEKEWIDSKTNESNMMQGRNTRADVVCDESRD